MCYVIFLASSLYGLQLQICSNRGKIVFLVHTPCYQSSWYQTTESSFLIPSFGIKPRSHFFYPLPRFPSDLNHRFPNGPFPYTSLLPRQPNPQEINENHLPLCVYICVRESNHKQSKNRKFYKISWLVFCFMQIII